MQVPVLKNVFRQLLLLIPVLFLVLVFFVVKEASAQSYWVDDPGDCPTSYAGQSDAPNQVCGVDFAGPFVKFYDTDTLSPPTASTTSSSNFSSSYDGGYIFDCYDMDSGADPWCDNDGAWWCDTDTTCSGGGRYTICTEDVANTSTCGTCLATRLDCNSDGTGSDGDCEITKNTTASSTASNVLYADTCSTYVCSSGYNDCDGDSTGSDGDCEIQDGVACAGPGGLMGTYSGCSGGTGFCDVPASYFETGTEAKYATSSPLLWGTQYGDGVLMQLSASTTDNGEIFTILNDGRVGIGTSTLGFNDMLTVGMDANNQFIISKTGTVTDGNWQGGVIGSQWGGTGSNLAGETGFLYMSNGTTTASTTIHIGNTDLAVDDGGANLLSLVANNTITLDATGNWQGTVEGVDISTASSTWDTAYANAYELYTTIGLSALTSAEVDQLENIGSETISATQWGYLGAFDQALTTASSPTFAGVTLSGTTASRLLATDGSNGLVSADLSAWVAGTSNQVTITDDADGTITISLPQDIATASTPTFGGITVNGNIVVSGNVDGVDISASAINWDTAYTNRITSATAPLNIASNILTISLASSSADGYLSSTDWSTFNNKFGGLSDMALATGNIYIGDASGHPVATSNFFMDTDGNIGIGTTSPQYLLDIYGSKNTYLSSIYNASTSASASGLFIRSNGDGNLLTLNHNGTDVVNVTGAQTTFNQPVSFAGSGDISVAQDIIMTNGTAGNLIFQGPGYVKTDSAWQDLDLVLSAANLGDVIVDDRLTINGTTTIANVLYVNDETNRVGVGTSSPLQTFALQGTSGEDLFNIASSTGASVFYIDESGNVGISNTSALAKLDVYGDVFLSGTSRYLNFGATTSVGVTGYGIRDNAGSMEYRDANGTWQGFGDVSSMGGMSDVAITSEDYGDLLMWNGSNWVDTATSSLGLAALSDFSSTATGLDYDSSTGVFSLDALYNIPLTASTSDWATAFGWGNHASAGYLVASNNLSDLTSTSSARTTLGLASIYDYAINSVGTNGQIWMADGTGRGAWQATSSLGLSLNSLTDVSLSGSANGELLMFNGSDWVNTATSSLGLLGSSVTSAMGNNYLGRWTGSAFENSLFYDNGTALGIGTTTPLYTLDIVGSGNLFRIATSGGDILTVTDTSITSYVPHTFAGSGDVDIAGALNFSNTTQANITSYAPMYITAGDPGTDANLNLAGAGAGQVYIDDAMTVTGSTTMAIWNDVIIVDGNTYAQNSTGIQAAIDALPRSGGKVFLPAGTYSMTATTTIPSNVWLEGAGASSTILYLADSANTTVLADASSTTINYNIKISNLKIDGNNAGNTGAQCHGIYLRRAQNSEISNVYVYNSEDYGINYGGNGEYNNVLNNIIEQNGVGIYYYARKGLIAGNKIMSNSYGIDNEGYNNVIQNNTIYSNSQHGIYSTRDDSVFANNSIYLNSSHGIYLNTASNNTISGNNISDNGLSGAYDGIKIASGNNNVLTGNKIGDNGGSGYAISIDSGSSDNVITGNDYSGTGAETINDAGVNTRYNQPERIKLVNTATTSEVAYPTIYAQATTSGALVDIRQTGTGEIMNVYNGDTQAFTIDENGYVGIGTTGPSALLAIDANGSVDIGLAFGDYAEGSVGIDMRNIGFSTDSSQFLYLRNGNYWSGNGDLGATNLSASSFGLATSPAIRFSDDSDTGLYRPAVNSLGFTTGGVEGLRINASQNIGIGTTSPLAKLDIYGDIFLSGANRYINFGTSTATSTDGYGFRDNIGTIQYKNEGGSWTNIGSAGSAGALGSLSDITVSSVADGDILVYNNGSSEWINGGNIASGTAGYISYYSANGRNLGATSSLTINDNGTVSLGNSGSAANPSLSFVGDTDTGIYRPSTNQIGFTAGGGQIAYMTTVGLSMGNGSDGYAFIRGAIAGTAATPAYSFHGGTDMGMYRTSDDQLGFSTAGTEAFRIDASGNMMIGTSTAGAKLTIMSSTDSQLRLSYDADTYVDFDVASDGSFTIDGSGVGGSILTMGNGQTEDVGLIFDGNVVDFWMALDDTDDAFKIGTSSPIGSTTLFTILSSGNVGIGTTSPSSKLTVYGDMLMEGTDRYINFGTATSSAGYGMRDSSGTIQLKNSAGSWYTPSGLSADGTAGQVAYFASDGSVISGNSSLFIDVNGNIGIGTTTLNNIFTVASSTTGENLFTIDNNGGLTLHGSSRQIFTEAGEDLQIGWSSGGQVEIVSGGGAGDNITLTTFGSNAITFDPGNSEAARFTADGYFGLGTSTPAYTLDVYGSVNNYLASIYNATTSASSSGLFVRTNGDGNILTLNHNGTNVMTVTGAQTTFNNPVAFGSVGDVSMAHDLVMANGTAGNILFNGPGYIKTNSAWQNLDLTLSAANLGDVVVDDKLVVTGTTTLADVLYANYQTGRVGIGTSSPLQTFAIQGTAGTDILNIASSTGESMLYMNEAGKIGLGTTSPNSIIDIYKSDASASDVVFSIASSTGVGFKILGDGEAISDQAFNSAGADYAEYFYTVDTDLVAGEVVCVDIENNNAVERCTRAGDGNVMGIVSTKPSIIGNNQEGYREDDNYAVIGMLGQVPAKVSTENGPIRPGDSLTSASIAGFVMRANPGDPTVGVALESLDADLMVTESASSTEILTNNTWSQETGTLKVLISRRNKSLTVDAVESQITQRIAEMEIEDEVQILIATAVDNMNLDSEIGTIVDEQMAMFDTVLTVEFNAVNGQLVNLNSVVDELVNRVGVLENNFEQLNAQLAIVNNQLVSVDTDTETEDNKLFTITDEGSIILTNDQEIIATVETSRSASITDTEISTSSEVEINVAVVEIITATSTVKTAFVVNQRGDEDVADFQVDGVSIMNIDNDASVTIVGEMMVDGRIMVCSGGACGSSLDSAVDETMGDMGVEGKVVAGAFESYCDDGYAWVPGSAKYGTMPGFCVSSNEASIEFDNENPSWTNINQGEAILACQQVGDGHHLITENEWLTIAENTIRVIDNDIDPETEGLQLVETSIYGVSTSTIATTTIVLSNGTILENIIGGIAEWTDQTITTAGVFEPISDDWQEYYTITNFKGYNIAPPYYYSSENNIGRVKTADTGASHRGFVRGASALYDLDLSIAPTTATSTIGFRCAK